jgi:hypothetical protein
MRMNTVRKKFLTTIETRRLGGPVFSLGRGGEADFCGFCFGVGKRMKPVDRSRY